MQRIMLKISHLKLVKVAKPQFFAWLYFQEFCNNATSSFTFYLLQQRLKINALYMHMSRVALFWLSINVGAWIFTFTGGNGIVNSY